MKYLRLFGSLLSIYLLFTGCATPAYVQKADNINLSDYKTYAWVNTRATENDESKRATAYADISVQNAVNIELQKWGWKEVNDNPDALVSYDILVEKNTETQKDPVDTQPVTRYYYNYYSKRWTAIYYPSQFAGYDVYEKPVKEGTLTISVIDEKKDKNIWQGWTTERLDNTRLSEVDIK